MKKAVWRPERRNRNIGTAASGHGQSNKMTIPNSRLDRFGMETVFPERIKPTLVETIEIGGNSLTVLYEEPRPGFTYGCSPKDVAHLLSQIPADDFVLIDLMVFRQPTRKQAQQNPVWGRLRYCAAVGNHLGPAVYLEAQKIGASLRWSRKLSLDSQAELARLRDDGHMVTENRREFVITPSENSIRNTLLYRTVLHEIGHWVQYDREALDETTGLSEDFDLAYDLYFSKPDVEREHFAHRYATETATLLRSKGVLPFDPID
jgi:hypothetical protein